MRPDDSVGAAAGRSLSCLVLAFLLLTPPFASASQDDEAGIDSTQFSLEELMDMRIERVVSVSRGEQRITEAPASVTVITADEIRKYGYRTLADIIRAVPGFYVSYDRTYSYIGVRGFSRPGDYNTRVLLMIDGHRLNDNVYDLAEIGTDFPLDIDLIDHIEFIRGPGSSLYGSNAFFGTINVFTRGADDVNREFSVSAGDNETWKGRTSYGGRYNSGLEMLLSGSIMYSSGQRKLSYPEYAGDPNGPYFRNNDYDRTKSFYSRFSLGDFTLSGLYQTREKGVPTGVYDSLYNTRPNDASDDRGYVDLSYKREFGNAASISARLYYDAYVYNQQYAYNNESTSDGLPHVINRDTVNGRWWGMETFATLPLENHRISVGGEYRGNLGSSQSNYDLSPYYPYLNDNRHSRTFGLFVQDEYRILKPLLLNVGVRYDNYDRFDSVNPRASLIYQPTPTTTFKLIYGRAFRAPNSYELYYDDGESMMNNSRLKPEKISTYEAVWEQYYSTVFNTTVSGFYSRIDDLITQTEYSTSNPVLIFRNLDKVDSVGVELTLQGKWENGLQGRLSYSWQETTLVKTGERLSNSPQNMVKANVSIPLYKTLLFISPELQYASPRLTLAGNRTRDAVLVNVTLLSRDLVKGVEASASVYNLFDVSYGDPAGTGYRQDSIRQDGIDFRFKLTYRF